MTPKGLLLQFLPPFSIIGRFFITASIFGLIGSILALFMSISENFNLPLLVHSFTLGFLAMTMVGALFQMLPVVAGAVIKKASLKATLTHLLLLIGIPLLLIGLFTADKELILLGTAFTAGGLLGVSAVFAFSLLRVKSHIPTSRGIKFSLLNFVIGVSLGVLLILNMSGIYPLDHLRLLNLHLSFMLIGWVFLLVASVSFQVVEMFFVTPPYPKRFAWYLPPIIAVLLAMKFLLYNSILLDPLLSILMILQAVLTLDRLRKRRRKIPDPLINFWQVGMVALILSSALYPFLHREFLLFLFLFGTFAQSVVFAMMYRIVPFLVWLHLSNRGVINPPTMHEIISRRRVYVNLYLHLLSIVSFLTAYFFDLRHIFIISSVLYFISFLVLLVNLISGVLIYVRRGAETDVSLPPLRDRR